MGPSLGKGEQKLLTSEEGQMLSAHSSTFNLHYGLISVTDILCASGKVIQALSLHPLAAAAQEHPSSSSSSAQDLPLPRLLKLLPVPA